MTVPFNSTDPVPPSAYPQFLPVTTPPPAMPAVWRAVALLHPFSPPQSNDLSPESPFFELCVANVNCYQGVYFSAQISGCQSGRSWWYVITSTETQLSTDQGRTWKTVDMGWSLPTNWFGGEAGKAACAGASPLNWMAGPTVDWWKVPVPNPSVPSTSPSAATWMWFDSGSGAPLRMMFGQGPLASSTKGDPTQLAVFQMYSFTYIPVFQALKEAPQFAELTWNVPSFAGFAVGNPNKYRNFVWNPNFAMTVFMTPVNEAYNPLPTRVLYTWKPDSEYSVYTDRAQDTLMLYTYNPIQPPPQPPLAAQVALLTGPAPQGSDPTDSGTGFLIGYNTDGTTSCIGGSKFPFPQEPPDWVSIPGVGGQIQATITDNPVLCPGNVVTVFSVLFPPSPPNYPDSTYLWTWYAPQSGDGTASRPVTFMQSQSGVGVGTSLALADYFYYQNFAEWFDLSNFTVPSFCSAQTRNTGLRSRLP